MKLILILSLFASTHAHAGWFGDFCQKCLVAEDPYQYETYPSKYVVEQYEALAIKKVWGRLDGRQKESYEIFRNELRKRLAIGIPALDLPMIANSLNKFGDLDEQKP